jgi:16S rRNA (uracil1498-N3)-methyltransferase
LREAERKEPKRRRKRRGKRAPAMDRIVLDQKGSIGKEIVIEGPPLEALRFRGACAGSIVTLTDVEGNDFRGRVTRLSTDSASVFIFDLFPSSTESPLEIVLLQALPEKERMELIIQKGTELGVSMIVPFQSERSISLQEREKKQKKAHRWQPIALKAMQQSRRARVPRVRESCSFMEALELSEGESLKIILWEKTGEHLSAILRRPLPRKIYAMVGPEGGFTDEEVGRAQERGFTPVKLGQRILRTETAAITLVGILQYALGDLG